MIKCVYCNRPAVSTRTETYEVGGKTHTHTFSHCENCKQDFVTPQQEELNRDHVQ